MYLFPFWVFVCDEYYFIGLRLNRGLVRELCLTLSHCGLCIFTFFGFSESTGKYSTGAFAWNGRLSAVATAALVVSEIVSNSSVSEHMALAVSKVVSYDNVSKNRQNSRNKV